MTTTAATTREVTDNVCSILRSYCKVDRPDPVHRETYRSKHSEHIYLKNAIEVDRHCHQIPPDETGLLLGQPTAEELGRLLCCERRRRLLILFIMSTRIRPEIVAKILWLRTMALNTQTEHAPLPYLPGGVQVLQTITGLTVASAKTSNALDQSSVNRISKSQ